MQRDQLIEDFNTVMGLLDALDNSKSELAELLRGRANGASAQLQIALKEAFISAIYTQLSKFREQFNKELTKVINTQPETVRQEITGNGQGTRSSKR